MSNVQVGRPVKYKGRLARHIVSLAVAHSALQARRILNANGRSAASRELVALRSATIVPEALGISMPTILKLVVNAGKSLPLGRRAAA